jgi:hypothetical protein
LSVAFVVFKVVKVNQTYIGFKGIVHNWDNDVEEYWAVIYTGNGKKMRRGRWI